MSTGLIVAIVIFQVVVVGIITFYALPKLKKIFKEQQSQTHQQVPQEMINKVRKKQKTGLLVICIIFALVGFGLAGFGASIFVNARQSTSWPTAKGTILTSDVNKSTHRGTTNVGNSGGSQTVTSYKAAISYEYSVNGELFFSDKVSFGETGESAARAYAKAKNYPPGQKVSVFYDPDNPGVAVLEPGVAKSAYLLMFMGVFFIILPFGIYKIVTKGMDMTM